MCLRTFNLEIKLKAIKRYVNYCVELQDDLNMIMSYFILTDGYNGR